jgi:hypothetical protein
MSGRMGLLFGIRKNIIDGGAYRVRFEIKDENNAAYGSVRLRLFDRVSGRLVQEQWSDTAGQGVFNYIAYRYQGYTIASSYNRRSNGAPEYPAIADFVTPEAMP